MATRAVSKTGRRATLDADSFLRDLIERGASDLHLKAGVEPVLRIDGVLQRGNHPPLTADDVASFAKQIMPERLSGEFAETGEADFAYSSAGLGRFRCNIYRQRGAIGIAIRRVTPPAANFESLGLPPVMESISQEARGLILVTGMTGSGKSTTTAAIIDYINRTRAVHVMTIEDPIEIVHSDKKAIVNQREVGIDTADFRQALKRVLRQDPDVIFIGEIRDDETAKAAIAAAETGHLVISTLHTIDAQGTVNRIIDFFPPYQQKEVRIAFAGSLKAILSQRLLGRANGKGRVPAIEVLVMNGRIFDMIVNPEQTHLIHDVIAESDFYGMQTFDQSLLALFRDGVVTLEQAMEASSRPHDFELMLRQAGLLEP